MAKRRKHKVRQTIKNCILSFLLMLSIITVAVLIMGKYSMLSERAIIHDGERVQYYSNLTNEIKEHAQYIGEPYGVTMKMANKFFKATEVKRALEGVLHQEVKGAKYTIKTDQIKKRIVDTINDAEPDLKKDQKKQVEAYADKVCAYYKTKIFIPYQKLLAPIINLTDTIALVGVPLGILLAVVLSVYLIASRRLPYHGIRYAAYGILGAGVTLLVVFSAFISEGSIYRFNVSHEYRRRIYTFFIGHEMLMLIFAGIFILIIGGVMMVLAYRNKRFHM